MPTFGCGENEFDQNEMTRALMQLSYYIIIPCVFALLVFLKTSKLMYFFLNSIILVTMIFLASMNMNWNTLKELEQITHFNEISSIFYLYFWLVLFIGIWSFMKYVQDIRSRDEYESVSNLYTTFGKNLSSLSDDVYSALDAEATKTDASACRTREDLLNLDDDIDKIKTPNEIIDGLGLKIDFLGINEDVGEKLKKNSVFKEYNSAIDSLKNVLKETTGIANEVIKLFFVLFDSLVHLVHSIPRYVIELLRLAGAHSIIYAISHAGVSTLGLPITILIHVAFLTPVLAYFLYYFFDMSLHSFDAIVKTSEKILSSIQGDSLAGLFFLVFLVVFFSVNFIVGIAKIYEKQDEKN